MITGGVVKSQITGKNCQKVRKDQKVTLLVHQKVQIGGWGLGPINCGTNVLVKVFSTNLVED